MDPLCVSCKTARQTWPRLYCICPGSCESSFEKQFCDKLKDYPLSDKSFTSSSHKTLQNVLNLTVVRVVISGSTIWQHCNTLLLFLNLYCSLHQHLRRTCGFVDADKSASSIQIWALWQPASDQSDCKEVSGAALCTSLPPLSNQLGDTLTVHIFP